MPRQILGLIGPKGCGKSTLAHALWEIGGWSRQPFAGPLKLMLDALLKYQNVGDDVIDLMLNGSMKETPTPFLGGHSARHAMQTLGTEWGRDCIARNFWIEVWKHSTSTARASIVVEDVRFANEARAIKELDGVIVRIDREILRAADLDLHISEREQHSIAADFTVINYEGTRSNMLIQLKEAGVIK